MMKNTLFILFIGFFTLSLTFIDDNEVKNNEKIEWLSIEEAVERNKTEPRLLMVDVYTEWCGWCKRMDASTMVDQHIVSAINAKYYAVKLDAEQKEDIVLGDQTYKYVPNGRRGYNEFAAQIMDGKMSYPTLVFINEKLEVIQRLPGYKDASNLHPILLFFSSNKYKSESWENFQASYQSPYSE